MSDLFWVCLAALPFAAWVFWWSIGWSFRANGGPLEPTGRAWPDFQNPGGGDIKNACLFSGIALLIGLPIVLAIYLS